ncbi:hypothetical protein pdam_00010827, partial [Pocillopora damicornis]
DKQVKGTVYRITGSIPASNFIQFPRTSTQSLGLTGRFLYCLFRPIAGKYFVVHVDLATDDGLTIRISFSNMFKEFKSTSTWLQFPFVSSPPPGSVDEATLSEAGTITSLVGTTSQTTRWTVLVLDFRYILSVYLNRQYSYMKSIRLCANMFLKGLFTSDIDYAPGISASEARKLGLLDKGISPLPREMAFPLAKGADWDQLYDYIKFPPDSKIAQFGIMANMKSTLQHANGEQPPTAAREERRVRVNHVNQVGSSAKLSQETSQHSRGDIKTRQAVTSRVALVDRLNPHKQHPKKRKHIVPTALPAVGIQGAQVADPNFGEVHVYAHPNKSVTNLQQRKEPDKVQQLERMEIPKASRAGNFTTLKPDPILSLKRVVGFGENLNYNYNYVTNTFQVSALAFDGQRDILASAQTGSPSVIRIWKYHSQKCTAMFRAEVHDVHCISLSYSGNILCGVGKDNLGKQLIVVWDISHAIRGGEVSIIAKAHTDIDIQRMRIAEFDDSRLISCGNDNIRFWRIRHGSLRSCPVDLGRQGLVHFTDIAYGAKNPTSADPTVRKVYSCTNQGTIYQIDYQKIMLDKVIRLLPIGSRSNLVGKYGGTIPTEFGIRLNSLYVNESFCATGSDDGFLRLWPLDFSTVFLEAEHEGPITAVNISSDGLNVLAGTNTGNLGVLNTSTRTYSTLMRSHTQKISAMSFDSTHRYLATVSFDESIRVWDLDTLAQLFDFQAPGELPCAIAYHPQQQCFACGFMSGCVRVFHVGTTNLLAEHNQHAGQVTGLVSNIHRGNCSSLAVSHDGKYLASAGDKVVKIWDYHMRLDINFQVFIGHSDHIQQVAFTPDNLGLISVGEAILLWDFHGRVRQTQVNGGRNPQKSYIPELAEKSVKITPERPYSPPNGHPNTVIPRKSVPVPTKYEPPQFDISPIPADVHDSENVRGTLDRVLQSEVHDSYSPEKSKSPQKQVLLNTGESGSPVKTKPPARRLNFNVPPPGGSRVVNSDDHPVPKVTRHYRCRARTSSLADRRYTAPPNQAGLQLKSVLGYNGNGRKNLVWKYDTGLFAYTSGCLVVMEDLHSGTQRHLMGHTEEISTLALQHDGLMLASASGPSDTVASQILLWNLPDGVCQKVLTHHEHEIVCLAYSRDDRFLVSVGDYRECSVVVWSTRDLVVLASSFARHPVHDIMWDPYTANEFCSVGQDGSVLFWLLDETGDQMTLNVHEPEVPDELTQSKKVRDEYYDFTAVWYAGDSTMYAATSSGMLSAWDTRQNKCFIHWQGDSAEIGMLMGYGGTLIAGSASGNLRLWSVVGVSEMRLPGDATRLSSNGLVMEDEMTLDGAIISASFDEALETGIIGTSSGTLWYVNWDERTSIRLVSGHAQKNCNCVSFSPVPTATPTKSVTNEGQTIATVHPQPQPDDETIIHPSHCAAGYSDGTIRIFDLGKVEMVMKMQPHAAAVTAIAFSSFGRVIISGAEDGLLAISSPSTGLTVRLLNDHKGAPITCIHISSIKDQQYPMSSPLLWLAASADRRISIWSADWSKDFCELVDWLTFPAPPFGPDGQALRRGDPAHFSQLPPSLAQFSPTDPDIVVYTGYGMQKAVQFYSLAQKKVVHTAALTQWVTSMDISPMGHLIAFATEERLVKLMDYNEGSFQDFVGHCDGVNNVRFAPTGELLCSTSQSEILMWNVRAELD